MEVECSTYEYGFPLSTLFIGPLGWKAILGMHHAIAAYAGQGNNVIVDYIAYQQSWLKELAGTLKDFKVYFVGVNLPLEILEERELTRGTSPVGHARSHYYTVHPQTGYDLLLDTSKLSALECAQAIKTLIEAEISPQAFKKLS